MDKKTLTALKASIEKWERNAVAETPEQYLTGPENCALCAMYQSKRPICSGCPVLAATGKALCAGTPYGSAAVSHWLWGAGDERHTDYEQYKADALRGAAAEVAFLKSLLPASEQSS